MKYKEVFVDALIEEIIAYRNTRFTNVPINTVYIGGGTPSLLAPEELRRIFDTLEDTFSLSLDEVTIEMNPDDVSADYLSALHQLKINRASMGVQSFDPDLLTFMHRAHTREESLKSLELLSNSGFKTYTVDLIYGNPGQSVEMLQNDLDTLLEFNPPHVSAYSLTVEPKTRLGKQVSLGRIEAPEDDMVARHFDIINKRFVAEDIYRYEVSNYCKEGHRAIHNSNYWEHENYIGFGPGAHSFWWDETAERWSNEKDIREYISDNEITKDKETLTGRQLAEERIMMGLRTRQGVSTKELQKRYDYVLDDNQLQYLEEKKEEGKIKRNDPIRLTDAGIKIADTIILDFVTLRGK